MIGLAIFILGLLLGVVIGIVVTYFGIKRALRSINF
jgi:Na+/glutamate symporter